MGRQQLGLSGSCSRQTPVRLDSPYSGTRLLDEWSLTEEGMGYTFYWKGYPQQHLHGVGLAINNTLRPKLTETPVGISGTDDPPYPPGEEPLRHTTQRVHSNPTIRQ